MPESIYAQLAYDTIISFVKEGKRKPFDPPRIPEEMQAKQACFVSIHKLDDELRGCIGTLKPYQENLYQEIISNAIAACSRDSRFKPVSAKELPSIKTSVDVLEPAFEYAGEINWDTNEYGVIVSNHLGFRGVLLPRLEGIDHAKEQLRIAMRKAGFRSEDQIKWIKLFRSVRYE